MCFRLSPVNICSKIKRLKVELRASHHQPFSLTKAVSTISPKVKPLTTRYFLKSTYIEKQQVSQEIKELKPAKKMNNNKNNEKATKTFLNYALRKDETASNSTCTVISISFISRLACAI